MRCEYCGNPVRDATLFEKLLNPVAWLGQFVHGGVYLHEERPDGGYVSTFPLSDMGDFGGPCSTYVFGDGVSEAGSGG